MTTTLQTLLDRIEDDLDRTDLTSQITDFINRSIKFYEKENFWFTETTVTFPTVASTETYAESGIATNIKNIIRVEITVNDNTYELIERDIGYIRDKNSNTSWIGQPTDYCRYNGYIYLTKIPDGVYTIKIYYRKSYADLSATTDTNDYLTYAEDLIEMHTEGRIYRRVILDAERAAMCDAEEAIHLQQLRELNDAKRLTYTNTPTEF